MDKTAQLLRIDDAQGAVEFELLPPTDLSDPRRAEVYRQLKTLDDTLELMHERVEQLNSEIDSLTCKADTVDYAVAAACGVLTGLLDTVFVADYSPDADSVVRAFAKRKGWKEDQDLQGFLEGKYHTPNGSGRSGAEYHSSAVVIAINLFHKTTICPSGGV